MSCNTTTTPNTHTIAGFKYKELLKLADDIELLYAAKIVDQNSEFALKSLTLATFVRHKILDELNSGS